MTPLLPCPRCGQEPTQIMTWTGVTIACKPCDVTCYRFWTSRDRALATLAKVRSEWNANARRIADTTLPFAILFVGAEGQVLFAGASNEVHRIDAMIKFLLASWSVRPYQLRSPNHAERMILISNVIRDRAGIAI